MIGQIIKLIQADDWYGMSEDVEIAKGRDKIVSTISAFAKQNKRIKRWHQKNTR